MTSHSEDGMRIFFSSCLHSAGCLRWSTSSYLILCLHTLSYLIPPHRTTPGGGERGTARGLKGLSGNGRRECPRAIASVFCWQAVLRVGQMETQKCVGRNYRAHVSTAQNKSGNKLNLELGAGINLVKARRYNT